MKRNKPPIFLLIIIGLAAVGLGASLVRNPGKFFIQILVMIAVAYVLFKVLTHFLQRRNGDTSDEMKKYRKAAKMSNERFGKTTTHVKQKPKNTHVKVKQKKKRRKNIPHLKVIEGKKSIKENKNDRASN